MFNKSHHFFKEDIQMAYRHRHTLEMLRASLQTTTIKANITQYAIQIFWFPSACIKVIFSLYCN